MCNILSSSHTISATLALYYTYMNPWKYFFFLSDFEYSSDNNSKLIIWIQINVTTQKQLYFNK